MSDIAGRCRQFAAAPCGGLHFAPARALPAAGGEPQLRPERSAARLIPPSPFRVRRPPDGSSTACRRLRVKASRCRLPACVPVRAWISSGVSGKSRLKISMPSPRSSRRSAFASNGPIAPMASVRPGNAPRPAGGRRRIRSRSTRRPALRAPAARGASSATPRRAGRGRRRPSGRTAVAAVWEP